MSVVELSTSTRPSARGPLADVVHDVPYCSVSQYYEYFGDAPAPAVYGLSCVWQTFEVGRRLETGGAGPVRYLVDGRHVAAAVVTGEGIDVYDPYLLHTQPIRLRLDQARTGGTVAATVDAYPVRVTADGRRAPARVRAVWAPHRNRLRLEYTRFSPRRGHHVLSRMFTFATDRVLGPVPPPAEVVRSLLLHPEQNNLSVRVVDGAQQRLRELVFPLADAAGAAPRQRTRAGADPGELLTRDNQGRWARQGEAAFDAELLAMSRSLGVTAVDLVGFLLGGVDLYRRIASPDATLAPYPLENE